MKRYKITILLLIVTGSLNYAQINWNGYLLLDNRMRVTDLNYSCEELRLALSSEYQPTDRLKFLSEFWLRTSDPLASNSRDLTSVSKILPVKLVLREAYFNLRSFPLENFDLSIGKQLIPWGVATRFSPTDNLNPMYLEDIWDFSSRLAVTSLKVSYYHQIFLLQGVYMPYFTPAVLPKIKTTRLENLPTMFNYRNISDTLIMPEHKPQETQSFGMRVKTTIFNYDLAISYLNGRYDIPFPKRMVFSPASSPGEVDLKTELYFPKRHIFGCELTGTVKNCGIWAEAAMYLPEKINLTSDLTQLGLGTFDSIILNNTPYFLYVLGLDYTFTSGLYLNYEYFHGFLSEHGKDNLNNYMAFTIEYKTLNEKLKIYPLNTILTVNNWRSIKDSYGLVLMPEVSYYPITDLEFTLGYRFIYSKANAAFKHLSNQDEVYLKFKYNF